MDKRFLAIVGVIIVLFVGFLVLRGGNEANAPSSDAQPTNHVKGAADPAVTLIEYGDFQCPACAQYYPVIEQVMDKYADDVAFQFRHFPLISIHPNAFGASRAAEAASKQGKFWEMYDKLFAGQGDWANSSNPNSIFETYAGQIELDLDQYKADFKSESVNDAINTDMAAGRDLGATATPTFVLNGERLETPPNASLEAFSELLDKAIAEAKAE